MLALINWVEAELKRFFMVIGIIANRNIAGEKHNEDQVLNNFHFFHPPKIELLHFIRYEKRSCSNCVVVSQEVPLVTIGNRAVQGMFQRMDNKASKVQRAGETATPATTALTPAQQRTSELEAVRDGTAPTMAAGAFDDTDQKAAGIRQSVTDKAIASVKANIDADGAATVKEKKDAKKFAAQHAQAGVSDTLKVYSEELVNNQVVDDKKTELEAKAKEGYNSVAPRASVPLEVQKVKASAEAHKKVNAFAKLLITASVSASKTAIENKAKTGTDFLNVNVGDAGKAEVGNRHTMDARLVVEADMESVYKETLVSPMKKAVLLKLGVGRSGIRRSAELNAFRQKLKDNAREQARADIDGDINTNSLTASKGEMTKQYYAMVAKMKARRRVENSSCLCRRRRSRVFAVRLRRRG